MLPVYYYFNTLNEFLLKINLLNYLRKSMELTPECACHLKDCNLLHFPTDVNQAHTEIMPSFNCLILIPILWFSIATNALYFTLTGTS